LGRSTDIWIDLDDTGLVIVARDGRPRQRLSIKAGRKEAAVWFNKMRLKL